MIVHLIKAPCSPNNQQKIDYFYFFLTTVQAQKRKPFSFHMPKSGSPPPFSAAALLALEKSTDYNESFTADIKLDRFSSPAWQAGMKRGRSLTFWVTHSGTLRGGSTFGWYGMPTFRVTLSQVLSRYLCAAMDSGRTTLFCFLFFFFLGVSTGLVALSIPCCYSIFG